MDINRFRENLIALMSLPEGDATFSALRVSMQGMSGIRTAKLLNFACQCAEKGEFYLEVGVFSGFTLISAGYQNNTACIGVDDLSMTDIYAPSELPQAQAWVRNLLKANLSKVSTPNCRFVEANFKTLSLSEESHGKMAVLFIDGLHTYEAVKENLAWAAPYLAKDSVIVFDDICIPGVSKATLEYAQQEGNTLLYYGLHTLSDNAKTLHMGRCLNEFVANGIAVVHHA